MEWKAKKWVAVILGLLVPPLAMLYLARPRLALAYLLASTGIGVFEFIVLGPDHYPWQRYLSLKFFVGAAGGGARVHRVLPHLSIQHDAHLHPVDGAAV